MQKLKLLGTASSVLIISVPPMAWMQCYPTSHPLTKMVATMSSAIWANMYIFIWGRTIAEGFEPGATQAASHMPERLPSCFQKTYLGAKSIAGEIQMLNAAVCTRCAVLEFRLIGRLMACSTDKFRPHQAHYVAQLLDMEGNAPARAVVLHGSPGRRINLTNVSEGRKKIGDAQKLRLLIASKEVNVRQELDIKCREFPVCAYYDGETFLRYAILAYSDSCKQDMMIRILADENPSEEDQRDRKGV
eukprot:Gb_01237 [translate_table: standard]